MTEKPDLSAGRLIRDRYQLTQKIGEGGMGEVWAALNPRLPKVKYAIKFLFGHAKDSEQFERFQREAKILSTLTHENITQIHDVDFTHSPPFIVLEYLEGEPLDKRLSSARAQGLQGLPLYEVCHIFKQVGAALRATHAQGVIHRDLKPENIFLCHNQEDPSPRVKVLDFGVSKMNGEQKITQHLHGFLGTPQYMSPEQALGYDDLDHRADQFAFAIILYEMLSGELPFKGEQIVQIATQIVHGDPPYIRELVPNLPDDAARILHRALCKSPDDRFSSCTDFVEQFLKALESGNSDDDWSNYAKTEVGVRQSIIQGQTARLGDHLSTHSTPSSQFETGFESHIKPPEDSHTVQMRYEPNHFQEMRSPHPLGDQAGFAPQGAQGASSTEYPERPPPSESAHPDDFPSDHYYESQFNADRYPSFKKKRGGGLFKWILIVAALSSGVWLMSGAPSVKDYAMNQLNSSSSEQTHIMSAFRSQVQKVSLLSGQQRSELSRLKRSGDLPRAAGRVSVKSGLSRALFFLKMKRSELDPREFTVSWFREDGTHFVSSFSPPRGARSSQLWQTDHAFNTAQRGRWLAVVSHQDAIVAHLKFEVR